jgi:hypothetical protein
MLAVSKKLINLETNIQSYKKHVSGFTPAQSLGAAGHTA